MAYTIIITLLLAALIGNLFHDLRGYMQARRPQTIEKIATIVLSDRMTFHAAQNVCALCGWRLVRRGQTLYLQDATRTLQHTAVMSA